MLKEAIIKNALVTGTQSKYSKENRKLITAIQIQAHMTPVEISQFLAIQESNLAVNITFKVYQTEMPLDEKAAK